jgi:hypothetical protein
MWLKLSRDRSRSVIGATVRAHLELKGLQQATLTALGKLDFAKLNERQQLDLIRAYSLVFMRLGEPNKDVAAGLAKKFDAYFPSTSDTLNRELIQLLVYVKSPTVLSKGTRLKGPSKPIVDPGLKERWHETRVMAAPSRE